MLYFSNPLVELGIWGFRKVRVRVRVRSRANPNPNPNPNPTLTLTLTLSPTLTKWRNARCLTELALKDARTANASYIYSLSKAA